MIKEQALPILENLKYELSNQVGSKYCRAKYEAINYVIKALKQQPNDDVMAIHTQGLDEGIRCAMCTNSMKSDKGCDGGCVVDNKMYKKVMDTIHNHIFEQPTSDDCVRRQEVFDELNRLGRNAFKDDTDYDNFFAFVDSLPPVTPTQSWIPCSERLPKDLEPVNITWVNHNPKSYYTNINDKPFTATGVYFNGQWYWWNTTCTDILAEYSHNYDDIIDNAIEVTAWQPLPKPYKEKRGNKDGSN